MAVSDEFVDYVVDQLSAWGEVSSRKMFGGAGLHRDGTMFGLISTPAKDAGSAGLKSRFLG